MTFSFGGDDVVGRYCVADRVCVRMYVVGKYCVADGPLQEGSCYVADMLYVVDRPLREGSSVGICTPPGWVL